MKPLIYIAGPYTQGDPVLNTRKALQLGERVYEMGGVPIVPHLSHLWHLVAPKPYDFWMNLDLDYLDHCYALYRIEGDSPGADKEVAKMKEMGRPVFISEERDYGIALTKLQNWINEWQASEQHQKTGC